MSTFSTERRLHQLQICYLGMALWSLIAAVHVELKSQGELGEALAGSAYWLELDEKAMSLLSVPRELTAAHADSAQVRLRTNGERMLAELVEALARHTPQKGRLEKMQRMEELMRLAGQFRTGLSEFSESTPTGAATWQAIENLHAISQRMQTILNEGRRANRMRLEQTRRQLREKTLTLYLLLTGFGLFTILALRLHGRAHRRQIWEPLDEIQRAAGEAERGNFEVVPRVPPSVELVPLLEAFAGMAAQLRTLRASLEQQALASASRPDVIAEMAHEINNPLTSILGFSELLARRLPPASPMLPLAEAIRDEAIRLKNSVAYLRSLRGAAVPAAVRLREEEARPDSGATSDGGAPSAGQPWSLLVVDDEPRILELVSRVAQAEGWKCTAVRDPMDVAEILAAESFDAVICDLKMPGLSGIELLRQLRQTRPELARRFVLMTGNLHQAGVGASDLTAVQTLLKPFTPALLREKLTSLLPRGFAANGQAGNAHSAV